MKLSHPRPIPAPLCIATVCAGLALGGAGCAFKGEPEDTRPVVTEEVWDPAPVAMRIYPATRFVRDQGKVLLEARIELFDAMGDSIKAPGVVLFDLFDARGPAGQENRQRLYSWEVHVVSLDQQIEHYDPITRGYLFRLEVDSAQVARRRTLLRGAFTPMQGNRIDAEAYVRTDW